MSFLNPLPGLSATHKLGVSKRRKHGVIVGSTGVSAPSAQLDLVTKRRGIEGFGTDAGVYAHPFPNVNVIHLKEAVASDPTAANVKITIPCADNEIIR